MTKVLIGLIREVPELNRPRGVENIWRSRASSRSGILIIEFTVWAITVCILTWVLFQSSVSETHDRVSVVAGFVVSIFGVRVFLSHGVHRISVLGLFNLSTALFVGVAGVYTALDAAHGLNNFYLATAVVAGLAVQIATTALAWGRNTGEDITLSLPPEHVVQWARRWGMFLLVLLIIARLFPGTDGIRAYLESGAFVSIVVLSIGILWRKKIRIYSWSAVVLLACLVIYAELFHSGQGRLRVVALACTIGVLVSIRFQKNIVKIAVVCMVPLVLIWLSYDRLALQESIHAGASEGRTGLESMMSPIIVFAQLLEAQQDHGFPLSYGFNLLSFPALLLPGDGEPWALGYELVQITSPERYGSGYSVVASSTGEAVFNFGLFGLVLAVPVVALIVRLLDRQLARTISKSNITAFVLVSIAFWAICAGSFADFTWSGQHTYLARIATRFPFVLVFAVIACFHMERAKPRERLLAHDSAGHRT